MNWVNFAAINTNENWQYTPEFSGEIIRLRHSVSGEFPYGAVGLIAQSFNYSEQLELYNVKKIFPFYGDDIITVVNPFGGNQRLVVRGQTKYQTNISWVIYLDLWLGESNLITSKLDTLETETVEIKTQLEAMNNQQDINRADLLQQIGQLDAGIFTLATMGFSALLPESESLRLRRQTRRRLDLDRGFL